MSKPILYDLSIALGSIALWLTPSDVSRAVGYSVSILFSGRAYYTGLITIQSERKQDEKDAINYEADVDFHDQLLGTHVDAQLELKTLQIENKKLQELLPLIRINQHLQQQLQDLQPLHPELSNEDREYAAKTAIDSAFTQDKDNQIDVDSIRKHFPESTDTTYWKAILKALQRGHNKDEIVRDVLRCSNSNTEPGSAYYELLKNKYF